MPENCFSSILAKRSLLLRKDARPGGGSSLLTGTRRAGAGGLGAVRLLRTHSLFLFFLRSLSLLRSSCSLAGYFAVLG